MSKADRSLKNSALEIGYNWLNCKCKLLEVEIMKLRKSRIACNHLHI